jgi:HlyD family secretion protein
MIDSGAKEMQAISGKISWISSESEFTPKIIQTKEERVKLMYAVKIVVPNDGSLKIGMPGEVVF